MLEDRFPKIWVPSPENRDLRQLLWHRHRLVQMRTRIMNQLPALAMNEGRRWKKKLWSEQGRAELEKLGLAPWASRRRKELLELLDRLNPSIQELTAAAEREARKRPDVLRLMTHQGVGALTAPAYVLKLGSPERFHRGKQIGTYVGMVPSEDSSARIVMVGSCLGERVLAPGLVPYSATKGAVKRFTQGLSREVGARGITVNNVQPGPIDTDMNPAAGDWAIPQKPDTALNRFGTVDEVASLVAFVCGPEGSYITGANLTVDGGTNA